MCMYLYLLYRYIYIILKSLYIRKQVHPLCCKQPATKFTENIFLHDTTEPRYYWIRHPRASLFNVLILFQSQARTISGLPGCIIRTQKNSFTHLLILGTIVHDHFKHLNVNHFEVSCRGAVHVHWSCVHGIGQSPFTGRAGIVQSWCWSLWDSICRALCQTPGNDSPI